MLNRILIFIWIGAVFAACQRTPSGEEQQEMTKPNILVIVADDMGYSDISHHGGEIPTPNIDQLFAEGTRLNQFYVSPTCSPTRAMFLSGSDSHLVGYGSMSESILPWQKGNPGYEGYLNEKVVTLAESFQANGYHTYMTGKWHQGIEPSQFPSQQGFERSFAMLNGAAFHDGRLLPMPELFKVNLDPKISHIENDQEVHFEEGDFSTNIYTDKLLSYIKEQADDQPFFGYLAYTAPHWPLQAPDEFIEKYKGKYDAGFQDVGNKRIEGLKKKGVIQQDSEPSLAGLEDWGAMPEEKRKMEAKRMEIYAAMIDNMDYNIGRVISYLKESGQYDNTIILFFSDNGADASYSERMPLPFEFDNSYENLGKPNSFIGVGANWGKICALPYRGKKSTSYEGGIKGMAALVNPGVEQKREINDLLHITDVYPTLLELAGLEIPNKGNIQQFTGMSFASTVTGEGRHNRNQFGMELINMIDVAKAYRVGDYKIVWVPNPPNGPFNPSMEGEWELFNIKEDPFEQNDLANDQPEKLEEVIQLFEEYLDDVGGVRFGDENAGDA